MLANLTRQFQAFAPKLPLIVAQAFICNLKANWERGKNSNVPNPLCDTCITGVVTPDYPVGKFHLHIPKIHTGLEQLEGE